MGKTYKDLKKQGKEVINLPKKKERKHFAPPTKTEKSKKGKGSYDRKNDDAFDEDEEKKACWKGYKKQGTKKKGGKTVNNCVKESTLISNFLEAIIEDNHKDAHQHLKGIINDKIANRISQEIENPLF